MTRGQIKEKLIKLGLFSLVSIVLDNIFLSTFQLHGAFKGSELLILFFATLVSMLFVWIGVFKRTI